MRNTKLFKKVAALAVCAVMAMSMAAPAFATGIGNTNVSAKPSSFVVEQQSKEAFVSSRSAYYLTTAYSSIYSETTGLHSGSVEVENMASNGATIYAKVNGNEQAIGSGTTAGYSVGRLSRYTVYAKTGDGPEGNYSIAIRFVT